MRSRGYKLPCTILWIRKNIGGTGSEVIDRTVNLLAAADK
jgi:hypothetical protein